MCPFVYIHVGIREMHMVPPTHTEIHETTITNVAVRLPVAGLATLADFHCYLTLSL